MRARRGDLAVLLVVLATFAAGNVWLAGRASRNVSALEIVPTPSAFNGGPTGLKGAYLAWRQLGFDARVWRRPWTDLPTDAGLLVIATPFTSGEGLTSEEVRGLRTWVGEGHTLLLLGGNTDLLAAAGVRALPGPERRGAVAPVAPTGLMTGVGSLSLTQARWVGPESPVVVHAGDDRGPALISRPIGRGTVIALADATALANGHIKEADNAVLAVNVASLAGGPLYFDEYHHGFREQRSLASLLLSPPLLWVTLQGVFALILFVHAASRRFGPPISQGTVPVYRASSEHVAAMASLYQAGKARAMVLERLAEAFRRDVTRMLGLAHDAEIEHIAEAIARRSEVDGARVARVLEVCEGQATSGRRPTEALLLWAAAELETLRRQVLT